LNLRIDHVVIVVTDLARAVEDYSALGFTVVQGGEHADGLTHNALIAFQDGAYIELIAFKGEPPEGHPFGRAVSWGGGFVTYALLPDDIQSVIAEARERGLDLQGPIPGGRVRPDGQRIAWQTARPATSDLPFLCADVTPRELRVPGGAARDHANGVTGIESIVTLVGDLAASQARYNALLGVEPLSVLGAEAQQVRLFPLGDAIVYLAQPVDAPMRDVFVERGDAPFSLYLRGKAGALTGPLDPRFTHGVPIEIAGRLEGKVWRKTIWKGRSGQK
jgi:catechol 2,3-dioxygenase-like lactoylglutathione lyase family enzyme